MKNNKTISFLVALLTFSFVTVSMAQYDDLYYDPSSDDSPSATYEYENDYNDEYDEYDYDDEEYDDYEYYDDYDYQYSSRIRRFKPILLRF